MTEKSLYEQLSLALDECAPADGFSRIEAAVSAMPVTIAPVVRPKKPPVWAVTAVVAACVLLLVGISGVVWYTAGQAVDTVIDIDVNPGIELTINRADRILTAIAVNEDGAAVLEGLSLRSQPLPEAVSAIFEAMVELGYVGGDRNNILVTVQNADHTRAAQLRGMVTAHIDSTLNRHEVKASIATQTVTAFEQATRFAETHGISNGKAAFVLALSKQVPALSADRLATYDFGALVLVAQRHGVQLDSLVDYHAADGAWGEIQLTLEQQVEQAEQKLDKALLTLEQAKSIALHGFDEEFKATALFVVTEFIWEGNIPAYHLEFISHQSAVYCYVINAIDGSDLPTEYEKEQQSTTPPQTVTSGGGTVTSGSRPGTTTTAWVDRFIGEEPAESIAFAERMEAGADVTKAQQVTTVLCYRWGKAYYKVSFLLEDVKYTYEIDAVGGEILLLDKQPQATTTTTRSTDPAADGFINDNEAKVIAYKQFGITPEQARFVSLERQYLDGTATQIDFRFTCEDRLYVVYIHSVTGKVIQTVLAPVDLREEDYRINERNAERIALAHAGVKESDCTERIILIGETADGTPCFRVCFAVGRDVYMYEISGIDGTILLVDSTAGSTTTADRNSPPRYTVG